MLLHKELVQNTDPWLAFKATRPMSGSNAGACMGYGYPDCKNVEDLAQIHLGLKQRDFPDFLKKLMQVGHDLEPIIRQKVENQLNESLNRTWRQMVIICCRAMASTLTKPST